jgi:hypothetical protein
VSESTVIREFLVALGFKTDESALKKFDDGISKATKTVFSLAAAVEATAIIVSVGVARVASNLEALYFASIKAGDSASNLKAFDRASENLGTQTGEALLSVQGLARFLRTNPGGEGLLESLGVKTRDVNGQLRGTTDMMLGLSRQFQQMPFYLASQYAGMFGISEDTLRAMRSSGFAEEIERMRTRMEGMDWKKATEDSHRFMMEMRNLRTVVEALGLQVYNALSRRLGMSVEQLAEWLAKNGPVVADRIAEIIVNVLDVAERVGAWITWLVTKFIEWDKATDGWSTRLLGFLVVLKLFGGAEIIGGLLALAGAFIKLGGGMISAAGAGTGLLALLGKVGLVGAAGGAGWWAGGKLYENLSDGVQEKIGKTVATVAGLLGSKTARDALAVNDPLTYFRLNGWSKEQAAGIVANLQAESGMNPQAVGDNGEAFGIAQWHPDRQAAFEKWAGHGIRESSLAEQMDFVNYELKRGAERKAGALLAASRTARQAGEVVSRFYERPAAAEAEATRRGQAAVQIAQETTIRVDGSGDPLAAGRAVASEQNRVNAELVRNLQVAVQ